MNYDFETMSDRWTSGSEKYEAMRRVDPEADASAIPLSMADMEFKLAPEIGKAMKHYIDNYPMGYNCPTDGYLDAVKLWMQSRHGWEIDKEWILPMPGVLVGMYAAIRALTNPGDGIIICSPVFGLFQAGIEGNGRRCISVPVSLKNGRWEIDLEKLNKAAADPRNKALLFCNPHNPLGRIWTEEELKAIGDICINNDLYILSDEIHSDLIMPGKKHISFGGINKDIDEKLIVGTAPTKTFNLAGTQVGNLIIPNPELKQMIKRELLACGIFTVSAMGFVACEAAYNSCGEWLDECIAYVYKNHLAVKKYAEENIPKLKVFDMEATYLQWLDFRELCDDPEELNRKLCFEAGVFMDPGEEFGEEGKGFMRMNLACPERRVHEAMERIRRIF